MVQFDNVFGIGKTIAAESEIKVNGSLNPKNAVTCWHKRLKAFINRNLVYLNRYVRGDIFIPNIKIAYVLQRWR
jgi:hypothetical protein